MATRARPLSPHLGIWRWRVHMLVSILHRATGTALATAAVVAFLWWLVAAASGAEAYATFHMVASHPLAYIVWVGLTWTFFQHMGTGIRHLVMDTGAAFEIATAKRTATATLAFSIIMTALVWGGILLVRG
jgi:succinate dehydrogenase / fumarate reductase cytochrome b subunit